MQKIYSVIELNTYIKNLFDNNDELYNVSVKGEISNFTNHRSGHMYFSIKDEESQIKSVMFRSANSRLNFVPKNGMKVVVKGTVTTFTRDGVYQLYVTDMQQDGIGDLYLAFEKLKAKLMEEGLFNRELKKPLPTLPKRVGVITSPTGAAIRDIINVIERRCPITKIILYPAIVQGDETEASLIKGLDYFEKTNNVDLIIIGRGGGSIEDLWGFNSEKLARKIFQCNIPIISAVGHEIDFTICDFVADKRAPTPSAAAELAVPDLRENILYLDGITDRLFLGVENYISKKSSDLESLESRSIYKNSQMLFSEFDHEFQLCKQKLYDYINLYMEQKNHEMKLLSGKLNDLSPLGILGRGYSIVSFEGKNIGSVKQVQMGKDLSVRVSDGEINALIKEIKEI